MQRSARLTAWSKNTIGLPEYIDGNIQYHLRHILKIIFTSYELLEMVSDKYCLTIKFWKNTFESDVLNE